MPKLSRKRTATGAASKAKKARYGRTSTIDYTTGRRTKSVLKAQEFTTWLHGAWQSTNEMTGPAAPVNDTTVAQGFGTYMSQTVVTTLYSFAQGKQLASVFERYKVQRMRVTIMPWGQPMIVANAVSTPAQTTPDISYQQARNSLNQSFPCIASYVDIDDVAVNIPNPTQVLQHSDAWVSPFDKPHKRSFVPGVTELLDTTTGVITTSALAGTKLANTQWINSNTGTNVQFSGLKFCVWVPGTLSTPVTRTHIIIDMKVTFQGLNYAAQPDKLARMVAAITRPTEAIDAPSSDESDEDDVISRVVCPRHKRTHSDNRVCH